MAARISAASTDIVITGGDLGLLLAGAGFLLMCLVICWVLLTKASAAIKAVTKTVESLDARAGVMLDNVNISVEHVNTSLVKTHLTLDEVNAQLARVDSMTAQAQQVTGNVANLSSLVAAAATNPLVKVAAFGFGVKRAAAKRRREDDEAEVRQKIKATKTPKAPRKRRGRHSAEG